MYVFLFYGVDSQKVEWRHKFHRGVRYSSFCCWHEKFKWVQKSDSKEQPCYNEWLGVGSSHLLASRNRWERVRGSGRSATHGECKKLSHNNLKSLRLVLKYENTHDLLRIISWKYFSDVVSEITRTKIRQSLDTWCGHSHACRDGGSGIFNDKSVFGDLVGRRHETVN